jgi:hypothetical protein
VDIDNPVQETENVLESSLKPSSDKDVTAAVTASSSFSDEAIRNHVLNSQNPVGELIEIAQRLSARPPEFEFGDEEGPAHNRQFTCHVKFGEILETGYGKAKKAAKRQAAIKLLYKLRTTENAIKSSDVKAVESFVNDMDLMKINTNPRKNLPNIYAQLKGSNRPLVSKLLSAEIENMDPAEFGKQFFDKLAVEEKFEYKIYQKVRAGKCIFWLYILSSRSRVCWFN